MKIFEIIEVLIVKFYGSNDMSMNSVISSHFKEIEFLSVSLEEYYFKFKKIYVRRKNRL